MVRIETTYEHERLNSFYEAMGLEISEADPVGTDALKSFLAYVNDTFAGACTLAFRQGDYIIDGIAVDEQFRGEMLGTRLLEAAIGEILERGGRELYLVARAPDFFKANGFDIVAREDAPEFFECAGCDQYRKTCFPEVMKKELKKD
ncbi:MAG: GNAT family N-acetyltransferase [Firmicutes bacterium]|nr:GNAT family N-acetyltransferase [Bacillota bacterium]